MTAVLLALLLGAQDAPPGKEVVLRSRFFEVGGKRLAERSAEIVHLLDRMEELSVPGPLRLRPHSPGRGMLEVQAAPDVSVRDIEALLKRARLKGRPLVATRLDLGPEQEGGEPLELTEARAGLIGDYLLRTWSTVMGWDVAPERAGVWVYHDPRTSPETLLNVQRDTLLPLRVQEEEFEVALGGEETASRAVMKEVRRLPGVLRAETSLADAGPVLRVRVRLASLPTLVDGRFAVPDVQDLAAVDR